MNVHELYHYQYLTSIGFELVEMDSMGLVHHFRYIRDKEVVMVTHGTHSDYFSYYGKNDADMVLEYASQLQKVVK